MVPFLDLAQACADLEDELETAGRRVLRSGQFVLGPEVEQFESEFAAYCAVPHCVAVGSGLDALTLLLKAAEIKPGDEVIVPGHTFVATWLAVSAAGAVPVPVDVDWSTRNLDPAGLSAAVSPRTVAVIPVHLYGQPADMDAVAAVARRYKLLVIEDAAQAHGARYKGRRVGGLGHGAGFSFYPTKNLGALGDGGAVTTSDPALADRVRRLRNYGGLARGQYDEIGTNSRLDEMQAAYLRVKLRHLDRWNDRRATLARRYSAALRSAHSFTLPVVPEWAEPVWHVFVIGHPHRDHLQIWLAQAGIQTLVHYPVPPHRSRAYRNLAQHGNFLPVTNRLASEILSLPLGPHLSAEQLDEVVDRILSYEPATRTLVSV